MFNHIIRERVFKVRHPLAIVVLSIGFFFLCDNLIFRTAVYAHFVPLVTTSGRLAHFVLEEENRPPTGKDEVLLTGSSKMQFAFWDKVGDAADPTGRLHMVQGAIHGSSEKWSYYILKRIDPTHRRYKAIVISDADYKVNPLPDDLENDFSCAQALTPFISPEDWPEFVSTFTDPEVRQKVAYQAMFASHGVGMDLLLSSGRIMERIMHGGATRLLTDEGPPESVQALATSRNHSLIRVVSYPAHFDIFQREEADSYFQTPDPREALEATERNTRFHAYWLTKIVNLYKDSPTKLIFVQMPRGPVLFPKIAPIPSAPDIRNLLPRRKNVVFLDEHEFTFLEKPKYFWDLHHLNRAGRKLFSERLGALVRQIVEGPGGVTGQTALGAIAPSLSRPSHD